MHASKFDALSSVLQAIDPARWSILGIFDALILEVADYALGVLFQPHYVRVSGLT